MKIIALLFSICLTFPAWSAEKIFWGVPTQLNQRITLRSFVRLNMKNGDNQIGLAFTPNLVTAMPENETKLIVVPLPQVKGLSPFDHIVINWEHHGHIPPGIYDVPHFDFHFYFISEEARKAITCQGADLAVCMKMPTSDQIPPHHQPAPEGTPLMGWHWADVLSPEFHGQKFTSTFIYGYYNGQNTFVEPMITQDFLLSRASFAANIPQAKIHEKSMVFPKSYSIRYDSKENMYYLTLSRKTLAPSNR